MVTVPESRDDLPMHLEFVQYLKLFWSSVDRDVLYEKYMYIMFRNISVYVNRYTMNIDQYTFFR